MVLEFYFRAVETSREHALTALPIMTSFRLILSPLNEENPPFPFPPTPHTRVQQVGRFGPGVGFLDLQICAAISQAKKHDHFSPLGQNHNWPDTIDYTNARDCILGFKDFISFILTPFVAAVLIYEDQ
jgi:hypothetical protein